MSVNFRRKIPDNITPILRHSRRKSRSPRRTRSPRNSISPKHYRRHSKSKSPRAKLIKNVFKFFRKRSPSRSNNPYVRDLSDLTNVIAPLIAIVLTYKLLHKDADKKVDNK